MKKIGGQILVVLLGTLSVLVILTMELASGELQFSHGTGDLSNTHEFDIRGDLLNYNKDLSTYYILNDFDIETKTILYGSVTPILGTHLGDKSLIIFGTEEGTIIVLDYLRKEVLFEIPIYLVNLNGINESDLRFYHFSLISNPSIPKVQIIWSTFARIGITELDLISFQTKEIRAYSSIAPLYVLPSFDKESYRIIFMGTIENITGKGVFCVSNELNVLWKLACNDIGQYPQIAFCEFGPLHAPRVVLSGICLENTDYNDIMLVTVDEGLVDWIYYCSNNDKMISSLLTFSLDDETWIVFSTYFYEISSESSRDELNVLKFATKEFFSIELPGFTQPEIFLAYGHYQGIPFISASSISGEINVFTVPDLSLRWSTQISRLRRPPSVIDIDQNGIPELIIISDMGAPAGGLFIYNLINGERYLHDVLNITITGYNYISYLLFDFDMNSFVDLIAVYKLYINSHPKIVFAIMDYPRISIKRAGTLINDSITLYSGLINELNYSINDYSVLNNIQKVQIILNPENAFINIIWIRPSNWYIQDNGTYLFIITNILVSITKGYFDIQLSPSWWFPNEDLIDIEFIFYINNNVFFTRYVDDAFRVEKDFVLSELPVIEGEWQGPLFAGDWARTSELITFSNVRIVYEGTKNIIPPKGVFNISLSDNDGHATIQPFVGSEITSLTIITDSTSDYNESFLLTIVNLPGIAKFLTPINIPIGIDGNAPIFYNYMPDTNNWSTVHNIIISVTISDTNGSGIQIGNIEYSISVNGDNTTEFWTHEGLIISVRGQTVNVFMDIYLPDGRDNYLQWRACDLVGNGPSYSNVLQIYIDTFNVSFSNPIPDPEKWQNRNVLECGVSITDNQGSGICIDSIQYRISYDNFSKYSLWIDWDEGGRENASIIDVRTNLEFQASGFNYIQWRAMDIAGNGFAVSPHYRVKIDVSPIQFGYFYPNESRWQNKTHITCTIQVLDNDGGSGVDFDMLKYKFYYLNESQTDWISLGQTGKAICDIVLIELDCREGIGNRIQFQCTDYAGNNPTVSKVYQIMVDTKGPIIIDISPHENLKQPSNNININVKMVDSGSGINHSNIYYRFGLFDISSVGIWIPYISSSSDNINEFNIDLILTLGKLNVFQIRASDNVGNYNESNFTYIWINTPPAAKIDSPIMSSEHSASDLIKFSAKPSYDIDDDVLNYSWYIGHNNSILISTEMEFYKHLNAGNYNITLIVKDTDGATNSTTVSIKVIEPPRHHVLYVSKNFLFVIILLTAILIISLYIYHKVLKKGKD